MFRVYGVYVDGYGVASIGRRGRKTQKLGVAKKELGKWEAGYITKVVDGREVPVTQKGQLDRHISYDGFTRTKLPRVG